MAQKTRGGMLPTLFVLAAIVAIGAVIVPTDIWDRFGSPVRTSGPERDVTLIVEFRGTRDQRTPVRISWGKGEALTENDTAIESAWIKPLGLVRVGTKVAVKAEQPLGERRLSCRINFDGKQAASDAIRDSRVESFVMCLAVVTP